MNNIERIRNLLKEIKPTMDLSEVKDIIDAGYLDSLELMALITGLMDIFNVEIDVDLITAENFNSIEAMAEMIEHLQ